MKLSEVDILGASILIVDDERINVELLKGMLADVGYRNVSSTTDPRKARPLHQENNYDLILLDLHMPGMDGFEVMEDLKEIEPGGYLPVLVLTAQPKSKLRALRAGARDFSASPSTCWKSRPASATCSRSDCSTNG